MLVKVIYMDKTQDTHHKKESERGACCPTRKLDFMLGNHQRTKLKEASADDCEVPEIVV